MLKSFILSKQYFIFDAFGTLFKTSNFDEALQNLVGAKANSLVETWRTKQLQYTWLYNQMGTYLPFDEITEKALDYSLKTHQLKDNGVSELLLPIYYSPRLTSGAKSLLEELKRLNKTATILSNGTPKMLSNGIVQTDLKALIYKAISVDTIKIYKPDPQVYQMALDELQADKSNCLFFSSNQWDVAGASSFGLDAVWVNQYQQVKEPLPYGQVWEVQQLSQILKFLV